MVATIVLIGGQHALASTADLSYPIGITTSEFVQDRENEEDEEDEARGDSTDDDSESGESDKEIKLPKPAEPTGDEGTDPGDTVFDIVGEDVDGVEFELSDYEGKVILLDFWGDW